MYPPGCVPPGVKAHHCDGETDYNASNIVKWLLNHYPARIHQQDHDQLNSENTYNMPLECTLKAGEVIFVPMGWWHAVLNLEDTVAVTQNFVGKHNYVQAYNCLKIRMKETKNGRSRLRKLRDYVSRTHHELSLTIRDAVARGLMCTADSIEPFLPCSDSSSSSSSYTSSTEEHEEVDWEYTY